MALLERGRVVSGHRVLVLAHSSALEGEMVGGLKCQAKVDGFPGLTCPNWFCENF